MGGRSGSPHYQQAGCPIVQLSSGLETSDPQGASAGLRDCPPFRCQLRSRPSPGPLTGLSLPTNPSVTNFLVWLPELRATVCELIAMDIIKDADEASDGRGVGPGVGGTEPPCPLQVSHSASPFTCPPTWQLTEPGAIGIFVEVSSHRRDPARVPS